MELNAYYFSLSDRIAQNRKSIVCPMIDVIDHDNFGYDTQAGDAMRGAFDWEMYYKRIPIPAEMQREDPSEPFEWAFNIFLCKALLSSMEIPKAQHFPECRDVKY